jgi:prepilin-type N-terminal cleavage/methylation domain-containing protein
MNAGTKSRHFEMVRRDAFTLIELMVVIVIIAALVALSASAVVKYIEVQQNANTQSILDRTQSQLARAWSKVKDQAYAETIPSGVESWIWSNLAQIPGEPADTTTRRVRVLYVKLKLRQAFPMNFNEALNPAPLPPLQAYVTYLNSLGVTASTGAAYESSACLLMALQRGVSGAGIDPSQLTVGGFTGNANGIPYLTDAWNRPIYFSRVPVGSAILNPNPYPGDGQDGANDPLDPNGYLQAPNWAQTTGASGPYGAVFTALTLQKLAGPDSSYKIAPMVASGGAVNWVRSPGTPPFDPITFALTTPGSSAIFSNP